MKTMMRTAAALAAGAVLVGVNVLSASAADFAGTPTASDANPEDYRPQADYPSHAALPGGAQSLWDGGAVVYPADSDASAGDNSQVYRGVAATLAAPRPVCADGSFADDGTVTVTVSVRVTNNGPNDGVGYVGGLATYDGAGTTSGQQIVADAPAGHQETLTVTRTVPAADLAAGEFGIHLSTETYHSPTGTTRNTGTQWTADQFVASYEFGVGEDCADDIPIVAPAVALGAGVLALGGYGLFRRHQHNHAA
ncbi:hypothetical protein [Phytoactinopolyspora limicola]|uniref:hypothetical protein n=1 Tax=Phytoactinopolyspora limicola TaxID=2715536 RepID=UPI00140DA7C6|nr:hypothetical protein [Phytoactinopolyspora limicola]